LRRSTQKAEKPQKVSGSADTGEAPAGHRGPADQLERRFADAGGPADQWAESAQTLGTGGSWEISEMAAQLQAKLQQLADAHNDKVPAKPDLKDDGTSSKHEKELQQAMGTGVFDMRSPLGQRFYREIKIDKLAKAEFIACGKNYSKQRAFKAKFLKACYDDILEQKRTKIEQTFDLQSVDAEYCSFSRIVSREGGDLPAFEAAEVFVQHAMLAWQDGKSFHGHPWIKHDHMRGGAVVLHYRETVSSGAGNYWDLKTIELTAGDDPLPVENASDAPKQDDEEKEKPEEPITKKSKPNPIGAAAGAAALANFRANAAAGKRGESRANSAAAGAAETAAAAAAAGEESAKKNMQAALRKATALKLEVSKATQAGNDLLTLVAQNEDWFWCNCDFLIGDIRRCLSLVEDWKNPPSSGKHGHSKTTCPCTAASTSSRSTSSQLSLRRTTMSRVA
jgi:hypothetical protein